MWEPATLKKKENLIMQKNELFFVLEKELDHIMKETEQAVTNWYLGISNSCYF